jgi:nucleoside-diphosphate-sugar epimerase
MNNLQKDPKESIHPGVQTILGAGGVIGNELMRELAARVDRVRLVRRCPAPPGPRMEALAADLMNFDQVSDAVSGSTVAYLVAGLPYDAKVWEQQWPILMGNVIEACKRHQVRLVFLDNIYLYGRQEGPLTEESPVNPCNRKGEVRARISQMLVDEIRAGSLQALIARAADFYGPGAVKSFVNPLVFELLRDGKKAVWMGKDDVAHSLLFTPDAGRALAVLGNDSDAYDQVWHLPTDPHPPTGREFICEVARVFNRRPGYRLLGPKLLHVASLFHPAVRESLELLYQNQESCIVDSRKFTERFFEATPWPEGVRLTACGMRLPEA